MPLPNEITRIYHGRLGKTRRVAAKNMTRLWKLPWYLPVPGISHSEGFARSVVL